MAQGWYEPGSIAVLSAPASAGVKRSSSGRSDQAPILAHRLSGAGPTMEEATAAIAARGHSSAPQARAPASRGAYG